LFRLNHCLWLCRTCHLRNRSESKHLQLFEEDAPLLEAAVSAYLGRLPFLWLSIDDEPGPGSSRGLIEQNVIALASGLQEPVINPSSPSWLGLYSGRDKVRRSGLWNQRHVDENHVPNSLDVQEAAIETQPPINSAIA
jgi:hypothetical protein